MFNGFVIFFMFTTLIYSQSNTMVDMYTPVGDAHLCTKSVETLLSESYHHYPSIKASQKMILDAQAQAESAKWNYFPTPSVDISQRAGRRGTTLRLDQPLWTGGKLDALSDLATARQDMAYYSLGENTYVLAEKFLMVLQNFIQADGELKGFTEGKEQLKSFTRMLDRRIRAGVSPEADRELLNTRIAQINADIMMTRVKYEMSKSQLELLIGQPLQCAIRFENDKIVKQKISLEQMKNELLNTHVMLKKSKAEIGMARAEKKSADAVIMPNVSLRAEHLNGSIYNNDISNDSLIYVAVSFSPGAGLSSMSNMESAKYKLLQAEDELRTKEKELLDVLFYDYSEYHAARGSIKNLQQTIVSSKKVLESYTRLFIAGKRQWLDLVNTSREVTQYQIAMANMRASLIASSYRLAVETGNIDFALEKNR